jgi:hypothetical protein
MAIRYADEQIDAATRRLAEIDRELANLQRQTTRGSGWLLRGTPGAITSLLASSIPCAIMVTVLTALFSYWRDNQLAQVAIRRCRSRRRGAFDLLDLEASLLSAGLLGVILVFPR